MLVQSNPLERGTKAPDFRLPDTVSGNDLSLEDVKGDKGTVVMFICNHCPFVVHVNHELVRLAKDYQDKGIGFVAISSNDASYVREDGPEYMTAYAKRLGYTFPYLYDATQQIAKNYDAACTPDFYVFDGDLKSVYHGQLDGSRPGISVPVTGNSIRPVLDNLVNGETVTAIERPSIGCNIKWK